MKQTVKKSHFSKMAIPVVMFGVPMVVLSQSNTRLENPLSGISSIPQFFAAILDIVIIFAIPFLVFFIVLAGFRYVTAQGNPDKLTKAHQALLYALIGGVLILGASVLLEVIQGTVDQVISPSNG
jgi:hypothetical protein